MEKIEPIRLRYADSIRSFSLLLTGKFNVLVGDSGTGKSELAAFATGWEQQNLQRRGPMPLYGQEGTIWYNAEHKHESLIVVDEEYTRRVTEELVRLMQRSDNYYILCRREHLSKVPFGVDNVFKMIGPVKKRSMEFYFPKSLLTREVCHTQLLLCEDSKSGFEAVKAFIKNIPVQSAGGKGNLYRKALSLGAQSVVLFDGCGIGANIWDLAKLVARKKIVLFDCPSFEYEVLSALFKETELFPRHKWTWQESAESYYEQALKTVMLEKCGIPYSKSNVQLMQIIGTGKGMIGNQFYNLADFGISVVDLYKELREADASCNGE